MATSQPLPWTFSQRFAWRASTLLLAYVAAFRLLGILQPSLPKPMPSSVQWLHDILGPGASATWFPAVILSLVFFGASVWRRNPQLQFVLELWIAMLMVLVTPAY